MKTNRGVTLISVTIYVIAISIVIGIVTVISTYFFSNADDVSDIIDPAIEYTRFNSFFSEEVNNENIKVLECKNDTNQNYIAFNNGEQYTFVRENKSIYKNKIKICQEVEECTFEQGIQNGKEVVTVNLKMENSENKTVTYTLR